MEFLKFLSFCVPGKRLWRILKIPVLSIWVSSTNPERLPLIKEIVHDGLDATGFENITAYLYGDEMARMQCFPEVGLPYCAGYAVGYHLVKYYLWKTGMGIEEATILP